MKHQSFCKIGSYVYPIPPIQTHLHDVAEVRLLDGGDGYVAVGARAFPIKNGVGLIRLTELDEGTHTVRFVIGEQRLESDPIRISGGECSFGCASIDTSAKERIEHARTVEKIKSIEDTIERLDRAVFHTTIF